MNGKEKKGAPLPWGSTRGDILTTMTLIETSLVKSLWGKIVPPKRGKDPVFELKAGERAPKIKKLWET